MLLLQCMQREYVVLLLLLWCEVRKRAPRVSAAADAVAADKEARLKRAADKKQEEPESGCGSRPRPSRQVLMTSPF